MTDAPKSKQELHDADLRTVMATPAGRRFVLRLIEGCGVYGASYDPESERESARNEGRRAVGLSVIQHVHRACPDSWALAQEERVHEYRLENRLPLPLPDERDR